VVAAGGQALAQWYAPPETFIIAHSSRGCQPLFYQNNLKKWLHLGITCVTLCTVNKAYGGQYMRYELNTKQARELVATVLKEKDASFWNSWTNKVQKDLEDVADRRNLCFGIVGERFTEGDCKWVKLLVGCDKVHTTFGGRYLRLVGVKYDG